MVSTTIWQCNHCNQGIGKGDTARADHGHFYHVSCWEEREREKQRQEMLQEDLLTMSAVYDFYD